METPEKPKATLQIGRYIHCRLCLDQKPEGVSPRDWARLEVGWTADGMQIWCGRHEVNVIHIDFQGQQHPYNAARLVSENPTNERFRDAYKTCPRCGPHLEFGPGLFGQRICMICGWEMEGEEHDNASS